MAKRELLASIRDCYRESTRKDKTRILGEFITVTGRHRKHGIGLAAQPEEGSDGTSVVKGRRIYDAAARKAVILTREVWDRICG